MPSKKLVAQTNICRKNCDFRRPRLGQSDSALLNNCRAVSDHSEIVAGLAAEEYLKLEEQPANITESRSSR